MFNDQLILSIDIIRKLESVIYSLKQNSMKNKVLLIGEEGTGKTESINKIALELNKEVNEINKKMFKKIKTLKSTEEKIILFDEVENILLNKNRINKRFVKKFKKVVESLNESSVLIVITNTPKVFNIEFMNMFDYTVDFDEYSIDFILDMANSIVNNELDVIQNKELLNKILTMLFPLPTPIKLQKLVNEAIYSSDKSKPYDYLKKLYYNVKEFSGDDEIKFLYKHWFTIEEIVILTGVCENEVLRILRG